MTTEQIENFFNNNPEAVTGPVKIYFKTRNTVEGLFIRAADHGELSRKNFWRIVTMKNSETYKKAKDINLSRIFNGSEFTKLSIK